MARFDPVLPHLPALRRYAYVSTGSREAGDAMVGQCLRRMSGAPEELDQPTARIALFRQFHRTNGVPRLNPQLGDGGETGPDGRLFLQMAALEERARAALILTCVLAMPVAEAALVLECDAGTVTRLVAEARALLARLASARVLIIEDDYLVAHEIARLVEALGHRVTGRAATYDEAMACAAREAPTLVLADVQLRDGRTAGLQAGHALAQAHHAPLIVVTAFPDRIARQTEIRPGAILTKPLDFSSLRSAICASLSAPVAACAGPAS